MSERKALVPKFIKTIGIPEVTERIDPTDFKDRPGLKLWNDFEIRVLPAFQPIDSAPEAVFIVFGLAGDDGNNLETDKKLSEHHPAEWHHLDWLIKQQAGGKKGPLLTNERANIFLMLDVNGKVVEVFVRWCAHEHEWDVAEWDLDERNKRYAGDQVFCLNLQVT